MLGQPAWAELSKGIRDFAKDIVLPFMLPWENKPRKSSPFFAEIEVILEKLKAIDDLYNKASGQGRCTWLRGQVKPYTYSAMVNDVTACFHRTVERLDELMSTWKVEGKCMWRV